MRRLVRWAAFSLRGRAAKGIERRVQSCHSASFETSLPIQVCSFSVLPPRVYYGLADKDRVVSRLSRFP